MEPWIIATYRNGIARLNKRGSWCACEESGDVGHVVELCWAGIRLRTYCYQSHQPHSLIVAPSPSFPTWIHELNHSDRETSIEPISHWEERFSGELRCPLFPLPGGDSDLRRLVTAVVGHCRRPAPVTAGSTANYWRLVYPTCLVSDYYHHAVYWPSIGLLFATHDVSWCGSATTSTDAEFC